jgi:hypothetical protein
MKAEERMSGRWPRWLISLAIAAFVTFGASTAAASLASAAPSTGSVYIVAGIAGSTAAVSVDGAQVQAAAPAKSVIGPLQLAPGQHVAEFKSGQNVMVSARFTVAAGDNLDVVAHRAADKPGTPVITVFRNDLSSVGPGKTRLVVSHVAVAEPADIRVDGKPLFRNVANGESLSLVVPAKAYSLDVVSTATGARTILPPVQVTLQEGTLTRVFAIGNPDDKTSDAIVQVLKVPMVGAAQPKFVHTGDGGQAADEVVGSSTPMWIMLGTTAGALLLATLLGATRGSIRSARVTRSRPIR